MENKLREQIINEAEDCLKERIRKGVNKSEIDFLCGVASAMVGIEKYNGTDYEKLMQDVPPKWIFSAIRNISIFESEEE